MSQDIKEFLDGQNIKYNDITKYELAFVHSSYINEAHEGEEDSESNERIEFLGDSILGHIVAEFLYLNFPQYNQGDMTLVKHHFVNTEYLSGIGKQINIEKYMKLGGGTQKSGLSDSMYEDAIESLVGAIYLDAGLEETEKFIHKHITSHIMEITVDDVKDPKTKLQELMQTDSRKSVTYDTDKFFNEEDKMFTSRALFDKNVIGTGRGHSKKEAEKDAAKNALERMA